MGSKSYIIEEEFKVSTHGDEGLRSQDLLKFLASLEQITMYVRRTAPGILNYDVDLETGSGFIKVKMKYKKVVSSKVNQVCFLGFLLDLETGDFLASSRKKDAYFSLFNFLKLLESQDIYITPEVLRYSIEQYKFNQITFEEFIYNLIESSSGERDFSMTSKYLSADTDDDVDKKSILFRFYNLFHVLLEAIPSELGITFDVGVPFLSDDVAGKVSENTKLFLSDMKNATASSRHLSSLRDAIGRNVLWFAVPGTDQEDLKKQKFEEFFAQLTTGAHFYMPLEVHHMEEIKDLTPRKIRYALNLKDVLENDPEGEMYLDEMFMGDIDSKQLVDRIGLRDYVKGRFAGYSAQGFEHRNYKERIRVKSHFLDSHLWGAISPEDEGTFRTQQSTSIISDRIIAGNLNATFRKLQRVLRRMEQVT